MTKDVLKFDVGRKGFEKEEPKKKKKGLFGRKKKK